MVDSKGPRDPIPDSISNALAKLVLRIARLERDLEGSRRELEPGSAPSAESPRGGGRRGGRGGGGGKGKGGKGGGGRQGARRAAKRAAAAAALGAIGDDDFDNFEATAYDGSEHDEGLDDR